MSKLEKIEVIRGRGFSIINNNNNNPKDVELRIDLDNDYHHAILIKEGITACELADDLHRMAENIKRQEYIEKKKEEKKKEDIQEWLRPLGDF